MPADVVQRSTFSSGNPEETTEFFRQMYVGNRTSFRRVAPRAQFAAEFAEAPTMRSDRLQGALTMDIEAGALGYVLFGRLHRGTWSLTSGGREASLGPGDSILYPTSTPFRLEAQNFDFRVVCVPLARVSALASSHAGIDPEDLRFDSMTPLSPTMARHFNSTLALVQRELSEPDSAFAHPLVAEHLTQTMTAAVLATFANTAMTTAGRSGSSRVAPATVRRAVAFIEEHAGEPMTLADIAAAAGVQPRALQTAFGRYFDLTPMAYLRRVRLERAHRDLQAGDAAAGAGVAEIAARWGFARAGRFAARYQQTYGQTPSHTLRT